MIGRIGILGFILQGLHAREDEFRINVLPEQTSDTLDVDNEGTQLDQGRNKFRSEPI